jgi:hypothetical protein
MLFTRSTCRVSLPLARAYYCTEKRIMEPMLQPAVHTPTKSEQPPTQAQQQKSRVETLQQNLKNGPMLDDFIVMAQGRQSIYSFRSPLFFPLSYCSSSILPLTPSSFFLLLSIFNIVHLQSPLMIIHRIYINVIVKE